jgi:hypothetical protein
MKTKTTVIGGGLAGLTCATLLARGGRDVTLYEKAKLGGRASTQDSHGALFNQGPHALYRAGRAMQVLGELGITPKGRVPPTSGTLAWHAGRLHALPVGAVSLLSTSLLSLPEKLELGRLLARVGTLSPRGTVGEWLARDVRHERVRATVRATLRVSTYVNDDALPAALALDQLRLALDASVLYLDGGWRQLVEALEAAALDAGVRIVEHQKGPEAPNLRAGGGPALGELGTPAGAETVYAVPPGHFGARFAHLVPVRAACLDLALSALPRPRHFFALGIDRPLYFSVHSLTAQLGPHHVIQAAKYLAPGDDGAAALPELEALADAMQPGWRELVVARRFLPEMTVVNALPGSRPGVDAVPGAFLCGDWVGEEGMLVDTALASAALVAQRILGAVTRAAAA